MKSIHHSLTNPTVKALIYIHRPTMSWSLLLDPLYHMVQQMNTDGLLLHAHKIMELESVIAVIITVKIPLQRHPQYKGKHALNSGLAQ